MSYGLGYAPISSCRFNASGSGALNATLKVKPLDATSVTSMENARCIFSLCNFTAPLTDTVAKVSSPSNVSSQFRLPEWAGIVVV